MSADPPGARNVLVYPVLAAVLMLCALMRLHGLEREALTTDEYVTYIFQSDASLSEYTAINRFRLPDSLPGHFTLYWLWVQLAGSGLFASRLFSVLFGLGSCFLMFLIARKAYHPWAGVLAAALYALSPFQIFHDQSVRPYALFTFLAGIAILSSMYMADGRRSHRWFILNIVANAAMVYTHLLGAILVAVQGLYWLWMWRGQVPRLALWTAVLGSICLPSLLFVHIPEQDFRYTQPGWERIFANFFATDAVRFNVELITSSRNFAWQPGTVEWVAAIDPAASVALGLLAIIALILAPLMFALRARKEEHNGGEGAIAAYGVFFALVLFLPIVFLYLLSLVVEPIPLPRYSIYTVFARIALLVGLVMLLPMRWLRISAACVIMTLVSWQLLWTVPAGARTEFFAAAARIDAEEPPPLGILTSVYPDSYYIHFPVTGNLDSIIPELLAFHLPDGYEVQPGYSLAAMTEAAHELLPPMGFQTAEGGRPHVYLVIFRLFEHDPVEPLERLLIQRGLGYERTHYQAYEGLTVYRVWRARQVAILPDVPAIDVSRLMEEWRVGTPGADEAFDARLAQALHLRVDRQPPVPDTPSHYSALAFMLGSVDPGVALAFAEAGLREYPGAAEIELAAGTMLLLEGRTAEAHAAWGRALEYGGPAVSAVFERVVALASEGDYAAALAQFERYQHISGGVLEPLIGAALARHAF